MRFSADARRRSLRSTLATAMCMLVLLLVSFASSGNRTPASGAPSPAVAGTPGVTYAHDDQGRMTAAFNSSGAGSQVSYDQAGNITGVRSLPASKLAVAQIEPNRAPVGAKVDLYGTGFGTNPGALHVSFNGTPATVTGLGRNRATVTVPAGATSGKVTASVGSTTATYGGFTVAAPAVPHATGVSPTSVNPGDKVTVTGSGFDPDPSLDVVTVNGTVTHATAATATSVTFAAPPTRSFGHVTVKTPHGTTTAPGDIITPPNPFLTTDIGWMGRVKTDGSGNTVKLSSQQKIALALFDVPAGRRAAVSVTGATFSNSYELHVFGPNGTVAAHNESVSGDSLFKLPDNTAAGSYLVEIRPGDTDTGSVTLSVNTVADPATVVAVDGAAATRATTAAGQNARFDFPAKAGQRIFTRITTNNATGGASARIESPTGAVIASTTDLSGGSGDQGSIGTTALPPVAGMYHLVVDPDDAGTGSYTVQLTTVPPDANMAAAADGRTRKAALTYGQNANFTFAGTAGERVYSAVTLTGSTSGSDVDETLYAPDGSTVATNSDFNTAVTLPANGTYRLNVDPQNDETGTLAATIYNVPADVTAPATPDGSTTTAAIGTPGQAASISFTASANQTVYVTGSTSTTDPQNDSTNFSLLDPSGDEVTSGSLSDQNPNTIISPRVLSASGTYTIHVVPTNGMTGTIKLQVYNSFVTSSASVDGPAVSVTTTKPGQKARVTFTASANQTVYVTGSTTTTDPNYDSTNFTLLDSSGNEVASGSLDQPGTNTVIDGTTLTTAGTYTLQAEPPGGLSGAITVRVLSRDPAAVTPSSAPATTPSIVPAVARTTSAPAIAPAPRPVSFLGAVERFVDDLAPWLRNPVAPTVVRPRKAGRPVWSKRPNQHGSTDNSLSGTILETSGHPLGHVKVRIDNRTATTNNKGRFTLKGLPQGTRVLRMDGRPASRHGRTYGVFDVEVHLKAGKNTLPYTPYLPRLDTAHEINIASPTTHEVVLKNPGIPGLEVHIPAGDVILDADGKPVHRLGITPIPVDRTPIPMPRGVQVPVYYTIQPAGGRIVGQGARIVYPNYLHQRPGTIVNFWHYEKHGEGWETYGHGTVDAAGKQVQPAAGTEIYDFDGAMINVSGWLKALLHGLAQALNFAGDPVDLQTGLFRMQQTDLVVNDVMPLQLTRAYNSGDTNVRPLGVGSNDLYDTFLSSENQYQEADLNFVDGSTIHYVRTSPGTDYTDAVFTATDTPTRFAGSTIAWNGAGWNLILRDGTTLIYGELAPLQAIRDPNGNQITIIRTDTNSYGNYIGDIAEVRSPNGYWLHYTYDSNDRITQVDDDAGRTVKYGYDDTGHLTSVIDVDGGKTTYGYDSAGRLSTITNARNKQYLTNTYDSNGRVATQKLNTGVTYTFTYTVDANNNVTATTVTDNSGHTRKVTFDANGNMTGDTLASGTPNQHTIGVSLDPTTGIPATVTDGQGRTVKSTLDPLGQVTSTTDQPGTNQTVSSSATYTNTPYGLPDSVTDPNGKTSHLTYDQAGNVLSATDPLNNTSHASYTSQGQPQTVQSPLGHTTTDSYDAGGNLASSTDPAGRTTRYFHDAANRTVVTTAPDGLATRVFYDPANLVTKVVDPDGNTTQYSYDPDGNLTSLTDARQVAAGTSGKSTTFVYDDADRLVARTDQLGKTDTYTYDPATGQLATWTDRRGKTTDYHYDSVGRLATIGYGRTGTTPNYTYESKLFYAYDGAGRLQTVADSANGGAFVNYGYDSLDRVTRETGPTGTVTYGYDNDGNVTSVTPSNLTGTTYAYDNAGRPAGITQGASKVAYTFNADGQITTETLPDGVVVTPGYDTSGTLTGLTYTKGSTKLGDLAYGYDADGRINTVTGSFARINLPAAESGETYDAANRLTAIGTKAFTYDAAGNLTGDGTSSYTWNARGQLTRISGPQSSTLAYDPVGRLQTSTVAGVTTTYRYRGDQQIAQSGSDGSASTYLAGLGEDDIIAATDKSGAVHSYLPDIQGTTIAVADANGQTSAAYSYDPFGNVTAAAGDTNPMRYTGAPSGPGLPNGLQYNRARYYSPTQHRFISQDPISFAGGDPNLYRYAAGDPADNTDPSGNFASLAVDCGLGALVNDVGGYLAGTKHDLGDYIRGGAKGCAAGVLTPDRVIQVLEDARDILAAWEWKAAGGTTALESRWAQVPNNGFLGGWTTKETLQPGTIIDRYGHKWTGRFFSPQGTPIAARSLPTAPALPPRPYYAWRVLKPFDVQAGIVAPAFGEPGLGIQYMASQNVFDLYKGGYIGKVGP